MGYIVRSDLDARYGTREITELLDTDNNGSEDTERLDGIIEDASALVDSYVAGAYTVPLAPCPTVILAIVSDVVRFKLWDDRAPDEVRKRYDDALKQLRDIATGLMKLPGLSNISTQQIGGIEYTETERLFTLETLTGF